MTDNKILSGLNEKQTEAVNHTNGPLLIVAPAGSGKTKVITHRTANLIENGVSPQKILMLTFTRKAAEEMTKRISRLTRNGHLVKTGTYHSYAVGLLSKYGPKIGLSSNFSILDEEDSIDIIGQLVSQSLATATKPNKIKQVISKSINKELPIEQILVKEYPELHDHLADLINLHTRYAEFKIEHNLVDFDDLLLYMQVLLEECPEVVGDIEYVVIDEYQDTNRIQESIVRAFKAHHSNVCAVGDPSQSIYSFRGAEFDNIFNFEHIWGEPTTKVVLEINYRSTQEILDVASRIEKSMKKNFNRKLVSHKGESKDVPEVIECGNDMHQARVLVSDIKKAKAEYCVDFVNQAVIVRSLWQARAIENELMKERIPYRIVGGMKINESAHIKDWVALLKIINNSFDVLSWERILTYYPKVGKTKAKSVIAEFNRDIKHNMKILDKHGTPKNKLGELKTNIEKILSSNDNVRSSVDFMKTILKWKFDDHEDRHDDIVAIANLQQDKSIDQFVTMLMLENVDIGNKGTIKPEGDLVTITTAHGSKGLEWENVYIPYFNEGSWPNYLAIAEQNVEEEKRIFYVAITRAEDTLKLYRNVEEHRFGKVSPTEESQFYSEFYDIADYRRTSEARSPGNYGKGDKHKLGSVIVDRLKKYH